VLVVYKQQLQYNIMQVSYSHINDKKNIIFVREALPTADKIKHEYRILKKLQLSRE
jgi:hypothetical protein